MSTKATIDGDDEFHLYREQADGSIRLRINIKKRPLNIKSPVIYKIKEYVDVEISKHVLEAILDKKDWFMERWEHLHDDPILEILSELHEKKKKESGCPKCGVSGFVSAYRLHRCPWCGYLYTSRELKRMKRRTNK